MWGPGWTLVPVEEQRRRIEAIVAGDAWVLDTAYSPWLDLVLPRVDLIVALDLPRHVSLWRLVRRTVHRAWTKDPVCNGNVETWRNALSRDGIVAFHFRSFRNKRRRIEQWEARRTAGRAVALVARRRALAHPGIRCGYGVVSTTDTTTMSAKDSIHDGYLSVSSLDT